MVVFAETNMADATILSREKMLQFANRLINCHQICDVDWPHNALSVYVSKIDVSLKTNMICAPFHRFALGIFLFCTS